MGSARYFALRYHWGEAEPAGLGGKQEMNSSFQKKEEGAKRAVTKNRNLEAVTALVQTDPLKKKVVDLTRLKERPGD